jgi:hypothetical protein
MQHRTHDLLIRRLAQIDQCIAGAFARRTHARQSEKNPNVDPAIAAIPMQGPVGA